MSQLFGLFNLNKPVGVTSRDVVNLAQRAVRPARVGHAGTLDPLASGVLIVGVGHATRLLEFARLMPKRYVGEFLLGQSSPTEDIEGDITLLPEAPIPTLDELKNATLQFVGQIQQRPPAYSAIKVAGQRAYRLARKGVEFDLAPRAVSVYSLAILRYEYPLLELEIECGSGVYVRSLGRDLARAVASDAVMRALTRTAIGKFRLEDALDPTTLDRENAGAALLPPERALGDMPRYPLSEAEAIEISYGRRLILDLVTADISAASDQIAAFTPSGELAATLRRATDGRWKPELNFSARVTGKPT